MSRRGAGSDPPPAVFAIHFRDVYDWLSKYTSMRTNILIEDKLMRDALRATGLKTKCEAVEHGLRTLLRLRKQAQIRRPMRRDS